jgi:hypothetical protein
VLELSVHGKPLNWNRSWHKCNLDSISLWSAKDISPRKPESCSRKYKLWTITLCSREIEVRVEVEVTLRLTVSQSVCLGLLFPSFCRKIALLFFLGRPLWREDGSVICNAICQWSESPRTHNHTLLSNLRLIRFPFRRRLRLTGITVEYSYPPPHCRVHTFRVFIVPWNDNIRQCSKSICRSPWGFRHAH